MTAYLLASTALMSVSASLANGESFKEERLNYHFQTGLFAFVCLFNQSCSRKSLILMLERMVPKRHQLCTEALPRATPQEQTQLETGSAESQKDHLSAGGEPSEAKTNASNIYHISLRPVSRPVHGIVGVTHLGEIKRPKLPKFKVWKG